ncbi:MAG: hypothetical protein ABR985_03385 [Methanotrichaceae archaeon]|jgi:hypothetical protein
MAEITAVERLEKIANRGLELIQTEIELKLIPGFEAHSRVKATGEALKALAEGIDAYKKAMSKPEVVGVV